MKNMRMKDVARLMLMMIGLTPLAGLADDDDAPRRCDALGTWTATVSFPPESGVPPFFDMISFLKGGVVVASNTVLHPASGNTANPVLPFNGGDGYGVWERGPRCTVKYKLLKHIFDARTNEFVGFVRIRVTVKLERDHFTNEPQDASVEVVFGPDPDAPPAFAFGGSISQGTRVVLD